ncbi:hypothetical protein BDY19DRAFT_964888 [Irpex rosettiformis]|uniref:Uncharacterized protein n=1 Tax=Irpex rosettiformis TaxID=378272 RepID=A0ACB8TU90_9APHY|nr:hypothetical protein BDY19DRAFT_964888 [Irpex rosettiformis]
MRSGLTFLLAYPVLALAHFHLQFPPPRGPFVADNESKYCDGYATTTENRTQFPLSGGFYSFHSGHQDWTFGVQIANISNPTSFDNFTTAVDFSPNNGAGVYCFPIDLEKSGVKNLTDGAKVTLQFVFSGGDGNLYQCADIILVKDLTVGSNVTCANKTMISTSSSGSSATPAATGSTSGTKEVVASTFLVGLAGLAAVASAYL